MQRSIDTNTKTLAYRDAHHRHPGVKWDQFRDFSVVPEETHSWILPFHSQCFSLPISQRPWEGGNDTSVQIFLKIKIWRGPLAGGLSQLKCLLPLEASGRIPSAELQIPPLAALRLC